MKRIRKFLFRFMLFNTLVWAVGQAITRSKTSGDLSADDLELYTFWSGTEFVARSPSLRRVKARVLMGGHTVDLRDATPSEDGLDVDVSTLMAGTAVLVSKEWDVEVIEEKKSSNVEVRLDDLLDGSTDRPKVTIRLRTTYGGALVGHMLPAELAT